ncbi:MAG: insulinase family protein [Bacteroidales bacterium]|nr:insulinase family protein [Bacteroidales bacterium]
MIQFEQFELKNGLKFFVNIDKTTPFVAVNTLYNVGSKDESSEKTGFAHLFEHLMFGGSKHIPSFDTPLQKVGGENNAFTTTDITNYYITLPANNLETAFWLESDRMLELAFSQKSLDVQKNVVIEEFKQRYLNKPYGDTWLLLRPLAYKNHPYQWATIGKETSHIADATLSDVKKFFFSHYAPNNAVIAISGNVSMRKVKSLAKKWFENIPRRDIAKRNLPEEPLQTEKRTLTVERNVPASCIFKAFHMCDQLNMDFYATDLISDILSNGKSARLYQNLVQKQKLFSEINAFITGEIDPGLFIITGNLNPGVSMEDAEKSIYTEINKIKEGFVFDYELQKVKNKYESSAVLGEIDVLSKARALAYYANLGDVNLVNTRISKYNDVSLVDVKRVTDKLFDETNDSTLYYLAKKQ